MEIASMMETPRIVCCVSWDWMEQIMRKNEFRQLRCWTLICQKPPTNFEDKLVSFQRRAVKLCTEFCYDLGQIDNQSID